MKLYIALILLAVSCKSYKLYSDKDETKGFDQFWADDIKPCKYSPKELKDIISDTLIKSTEAKPNQRVYGGTPATANQYPFLVAIIVTANDDKKTFCGGSVISIKYVLTAARCLDNAANATVILGAHDRLNPTETTRLTQIVLKKNFIIHGSWDDDTFKNDIALIKLNNIITFPPPPNSPIQLIKLADSTFNGIDGVLAGIPGWGYFNTSNILAQYVQYTEAVLIPNAVCRETYGKLVRPTNVCLSGSTGKTACTGDVGGPLFIRDPTGVAIQVGIASFGSVEGCDKFSPSVFTRVSEYIKWIKKEANL